MTRPKLPRIGDVTELRRARFEAEIEVSGLFDTPEAGRAPHVRMQAPEFRVL